MKLLLQAIVYLFTITNIFLKTHSWLENNSPLFHSFLMLLNIPAVYRVTLKIQERFKYLT